MAETEYLNVGQHAVQFYGHDEELAEQVADYLLPALGHGGVAVVIATAEHHREFSDRLRTALGGDAALAAARDGGAYLALDAHETVRALMPEGRLDSAAFDRVIGTLIRQAAAAGRPVRAFGEMVALLWDDGLVNAAIQLETMWAELGRAHPFSLFCGYPAGSVTRDGCLDAFAAVCRLHREIVSLAPAGASGPGGPGAVRVFAFARDAPAAARHFTVGTLRDWGAGDIADDAALVVTELAANAIVHAHSAFTVLLSAYGDRVRISVRDALPLPGAPGAPLVPVPLHGLGVVDALASRWGVESLGNTGKTVWVELLR
jgi:MEDS: MEthanogen/methylotroph, DcmR Sensory domain